jgi:streptomycin 6-kinase
MLKLAHEEEERYGGLLMVYWDGDGAARVFAHDGPAVLLERAEGHRSLADYARSGRDDEATRILATAIGRLHTPREKPLPELKPLVPWFEALEPAAAAHGGLLRTAAGVARRLLGAEREVGVLHGDVHHDNVLDFGARGWLAIDPKRLVGDRAFDYANIFSNPAPDDGRGRDCGEFLARVAAVVEVSGLERRRLLEWTLAYSALSAAWWLGDGVEPKVDMQIAQFAAAELGL